MPAFKLKKSINNFLIIDSIGEILKNHNHKDYPLLPEGPAGQLYKQPKKIFG
jgi:hypothetical protein